MEHNNCIVKRDDPILDRLKWFQRNRMLSIDNPLRFSYFRSELAVTQEQIRQLEINSIGIHPFSQFRAWYEFYLIFLYGTVLITKPMDAAFIKYENCGNMSPYVYYNILSDVLCWIDIIINFITGYEISSENRIEMRKWHIAKHYMLGPYFISDVLSSVPKCLVYISSEKNFYTLRMFGVVAILGLFKILRIAAFIRSIWRTAEYLRYKSKGVLPLICTIFAALMIIHWLSCMQFAIPRFYRINFAHELYNNSWFYAPSLYNGTLYTKHNLLTRYNHALFKSSAYILGIRIRLYELERPEEYLLAIVTYFVGKILIAVLWIILVIAMLNFRIMEVKFIEVVDQLNEYMKQRQLPLNLQNRILQHYYFKYREKLFKEELIYSLLSDNLKKETNLHSCKSLIENVSLFNELSPMEISKVVQCLVPEIFLPNDVLIHAGTQGDAMYFLSSGTVAVYTRSGKELCHLQDGAYFGEISLVIKGQLRSATIKALEASYVFRLNKKDLERCLLSNKAVMLKILKNAEERLKDIARAEEKYKELMFEDSLRKLKTLQ